MINFTSNVGEMVDQVDTWSRVTIPIAMQQSAEDMIAILTNETRKYIPNANRLVGGQKELSTGRLWSSWGIPEKRTNNPDYDPNDAIAESKVTKNRVFVHVGTKVPYARYANDGRPEGQGRPAYHFVENGRLDAEMIIRGKIDDNITAALAPDEKLTQVRQFNASRQKRDIGGSFGSVLRR